MQAAGSRSFLADVLVPDTTSVAKEFMYKSWQNDRGSTGESEFFDAESLLGSFKSGISSFVSASAASVAQSASYFSGRSSMHPTHAPQLTIGSRGS